MREQKPWEGSEKRGCCRTLWRPHGWGHPKDAGRGNHSRCLLPFAEGVTDPAAQLCLLQAFISSSPHWAGRSPKRCKHMVTSHIVALRTWHVGELCECALLPQTLPVASAPYIRLCSHTDRQTESSDRLGVAIFGKSARLLGPTEGMSVHLWLSFGWVLAL